MTILAIHQPNYLPWLGYFSKIARADVFVFLESAQFSKGGYTNRVQIALGGQARWLTVPVSFRFGDLVAEVKTVNPEWVDSHLSTLKTAYANTPFGSKIWRDIEDLFDRIPTLNLAAVNRCLIERIARRLALTTKFICDHDILPANGTADEARGDDRLVALCREFAPDAIYLSGRGGASYQHPDKFEAAGISLQYNTFVSTPYPQTAEGFLPGLSILDAVFNIGWEKTRDLLCQTG